jgi:hypothetical protein
VEMARVAEMALAVLQQTRLEITKTMTEIHQIMAQVAPVVVQVHVVNNKL